MGKNKLLGYALGPLGSALLGFISLPIVTKFYSVEDVGRVSLLHVVSSLMVLLFCLGLDQAYVREYHESDNKFRLFKSVTLPGLLLMFLSLLAVYSFDGNVIANWVYSIEDSALSLLTIICFLSAFLSRFLSLILRMQERSFAYSMSQVLPKLFFIFFIFLSYFFLELLDFKVLLSAHMLSIISVLLIYTWNTRVELKGALNEKINKEELISLSYFGFPLVFAGLAFWGMKVIDVFFLRWLAGFTDLGVYSVTLSIAGGAALVGSIFNIVWAPLVYKWQSENRVDFTKIDNVLEHLLAAVYFLVVFSGCFAWILMYLLDGKSYAAVQYLLSICILAPLLYTLSEVTGVGIQIVKKTKLSMYASIFALIINAMGNYFLIPNLGAAGAAISTALSFLVFFILRTEFSNKVWRKRGYGKVYLVLFFLLILTASNAFFGAELPSSIWWACIIIGFVVFKESITEAARFVLKNRAI